MRAAKVSVSDITKPSDLYNPRRRSVSLIERNPQAALRGALFLSLLLNIALLVFIVLRFRGP